jgi:hypothetical protein
LECGVAIYGKVLVEAAKRGGVKDHTDRVEMSLMFELEESLGGGNLGGGRGITVLNKIFPVGYSPGYVNVFYAHYTSETPPASVQGSDVATKNIQAWHEYFDKNPNGPMDWPCKVFEDIVALRIPRGDGSYDGNPWRKELGV